MGVRRYLLCFWPGYASLWLHGRSTGLATAMTFAALLNGAMLLTWVWPEALGGAGPAWLLPAAAWLLVLWFWIAGARSSLRAMRPRQPATPAQAAQLEQLFCEAQHEYLKGHWLETEAVLGRLLAQRPGDVEATLLQASVFRRTARLAAARELLRQLAENDLAGRWQHELTSELRQIDELEQSLQEVREARAA